MDNRLRAGPGGTVCADGTVSSGFPKPSLEGTTLAGWQAHLHTGGRLLGHHEAASALDAVVLVLLGAAGEVAFPLRLGGGG